MRVILDRRSIGGSVRRAALCLLVLAVPPALPATAVAAVPGDFDGDGYADVAIGVPGETIDTVPGAGGVTVLYGAPDLGLQPPGAQMLSQGTGGMPDANEADDHFGDALAEGDFNGDGRSDLAIGVPDEGVEGVERAGQVTVVYGAPVLGLVTSGAQTFSQGTAGVPDAGEPGDRFGAALVAGDFDGDGRDDLAVGAPGESVVDTQEAGQLTVLYGSELGLGSNGAQAFAGDRPTAGGKYGGVLAAGDFDADALDDVAAAGLGFAAVTVLPGSRTRLGTAAASRTLAAGTATAMSTGDFNGDGSADLAVGTSAAGGDPAGAGTVAVFSGSSATGLGITGAQLLTQGAGYVPDVPEPGDDFGLALAANDFNGDGRADLSIGAPGETVGPSGAAAGQVTVLYGGAGVLGVGGVQTFSQRAAATHSNSEDGDLFGRALTAADFNRDGWADLVVGAPGENTNSSAGAGLASAGQVTVLHGVATGLTTVGVQKFTQNTPGVPDQTEGGDRFGAAFPPSRVAVRSAGPSAG